MGRGTPSWCQRPGCPMMAVKGSAFCPVHRDQRKAETAHLVTEYDQERGNAGQRGYGARWRQVRDVKLKLQPACEKCGEQANTVHHRVPIKEGGKRLDLNNLVSVCQACHNKLHPEKGRRKP